MQQRYKTQIEKTQKIEKFAITSHNKKVKEYKRYSAASGMGVFDPNIDKDVDSVFNRADKEMYANKAKMKEKNNRIGGLID